jgi:hypothetical protein
LAPQTDRALQWSSAEQAEQKEHMRRQVTGRRACRPPKVALSSPAPTQLRVFDPVDAVQPRLITPRKLIEFVHIHDPPLHFDRPFEELIRPHGRNLGVVEAITRQDFVQIQELAVHRQAPPKLEVFGAAR